MCPDPDCAVKSPPIRTSESPPEPARASPGPPMSSRVISPLPVCARTSSLISRAPTLPEPDSISAGPGMPAISIRPEPDLHAGLCFVGNVNRVIDARLAKFPTAQTDLARCCQTARQEGALSGRQPRRVRFPFRSPRRNNLRGFVPARLARYGCARHPSHFAVRVRRGHSYLTYGRSYRSRRDRRSRRRPPRSGEQWDK